MIIATSHRTRGFTIIEMLVVISIIGILASLLIPAVQSAREASRRAQCQNNLRQLGMAATAFHSTRNRFPSSIQPAGMGATPRISGLVFLLPFLSHDNVYQRYDRTKSFDDPANLVFTSKQVHSFACPSTPDLRRLDGDTQSSPWTPNFAATDYSPTIGVDRRLLTAGLVDAAGPGALTKNSEPTFEHVTDGYSYTILYIESAGRPTIYRRGTGQLGDPTTNRINGGAWARPESDFSVDGFSKDGTTPVGQCAVNCTNGQDVFGGFPDPYYGTEGTGEVFSFHPGGAHAVFVDGSTRFIDDEIDIREFAKIVTRAGKEPNL